MKKEVKFLIIVLVVIIVIVSIGGVTYALYGGGSDASVDLRVKNLKEVIEYKNNGLFDGTLNAGKSYQDGISTNVVFYNKDKNTNLKGYIYLDLISLPDGFEKEEAFKWTIIRNSDKCKNIVSDSYEENSRIVYCKITGNFNDNVTGSSITLMGPFDLGNTKEDFDIYVWVDSNVKIKNTELETENLQLSVRAYAYQKEMDE